jgi:hypothetical protein
LAAGVLVFTVDADEADDDDDGAKVDEAILIILKLNLK